MTAVVKADWDAYAGWSGDQLDRLDRFEQLLAQTNKRLNLISRATANEIRRAHIEHCLCLAVREFPDGTSVADWGTGGGLPGVPLAIRFPNVTFHLVDSVLKKSRALESIIRDLGLTNVIVHRTRAEDWTTPIDYAVSRATAPLEDLWRWTEPVLIDRAAVSEREWAPGLIALKGGDLSSEIRRLRRFPEDVVVEQLSLSEMTNRADFEDKYVVALRRPSEEIAVQ